MRKELVVTPVSSKPTTKIKLWKLCLHLAWQCKNNTITFTYWKMGEGEVGHRIFLISYLSMAASKQKRYILNVQLWKLFQNYDVSIIFYFYQEKLLGTNFLYDEMYIWNSVIFFQCLSFFLLLLSWSKIK